MPRNRKPWKTANPDYAKAMAELRRSGATLPHSTLPRRERTRAAVRAAAIRFERDAG